MSSTFRMPVGVPKVFYTPDPNDEESGQWMDLYNALFRERYLFLCNDLKEELTNQLLGIMLYLNFNQENINTIYIFINSLGGDMVSGLALYDMMGYVTANVSTVCMGTAASMASFVLMGGYPGKRVAMVNSRCMLHQPAGGNRGQGTIILREAEEMLRLRDDVIDAYCERTGQPRERIMDDLVRDQWMGANSAISYGLADTSILNL